jgi:UDP-sugar pyrophosphorylase
MRFESSVLLLLLATCDVPSSHAFAGSMPFVTGQSTSASNSLSFYGRGSMGSFSPRGGGEAGHEITLIDSKRKQNLHRSSNCNSALAASTIDNSSSSETSAALIDVNVVSLENVALLSERGREALQRLISNDVDGANTHVYADWPEAGTDDEHKQKLAEQLADLDDSYPGGLESYLSKAKKLLKDSSDGVNPFEDYTASVPEGESLTYEDQQEDSTATEGMTFLEAEDVGLSGIANVAFVLVAGGLGERLGFNGIKLSLETNLLTEKCYLEQYCKFIQAMHRMAQLKIHHTTPPIPLVIMTSGDTDAMTRQLLKDNNDFGMEPGQIKIVCQDKVPALKDSNAGLSLKGKWEVETKPHGHGDVHHLLHKHGLVKQWLKEGRKHVIFLQDTNALVINAVLPALGVSIHKGFHMNSICIPRLPEEAAGAITRLEHKADPSKSLTINVEYNQLDPLLKNTPPFTGDVADPATGFSPYPGNANNLVFELESYGKTLAGEDQGVVMEFVNPKYKEGSRTEFKKPTRLECMMQDFPTLMQKEMGQEANIGFTMFDRWYTFSPAKNAFEAGVDHVSKGGQAPGTMCSAESDKYISNQKKLRYAGVDLPVTEDESQKVKLAGIPITPGPRVVLCAAFAITQQEIAQKIEGGNITEKSSLVLEGEELFVKNLELDGALVIRAEQGCHVTVDGLKVQNAGWEFVKIPDGANLDDIPESVHIRGYTIDRKESKEYHISEPGKYHIGADGELKKLE